MNKKLLAIIGSAVALVAIVVACIFIFAGGEDSYRSIKVFEIDGSCKVERDGDTLDAFKNMALSSGDTLTVGDGSFTRLKLDDDKYVYLEANTKIKLNATGTANDSKTTVFVERGSMLTEVKKKLSATSSYDIVTPNTTMSIRGTKTLTEVLEDALGAIKTSAVVIEGNVKFSTIQKDSKGNPVIADVDLGVGEGLGITTDAENLLKPEDVESIADNGKTSDGKTVESTTLEELDTTVDTPEFSPEFLNNIVAVLARSRDEDIEEGFAAEGATEEELNAAIDVLNDVIDGKVELPASVEEYIISQAQSYYDEPIASDRDANVSNPVINDDPTVIDDPVIADESMLTDDTAVTGEPEGEGEDTFIVDGTGETLVGIDDDTDDTDGSGTDDVSDDQTDNTDDETGDDESDETGEADEDDNAGEGESDESEAEDDNTDKADDKKDKEDEVKESEETEENQEETAGQTQEPSDTSTGREPVTPSDDQTPTTSDDQTPTTSDDQTPSTSDSQNPNTSDDQTGGGSSSSTSPATSEQEPQTIPVRLESYAYAPSTSSSQSSSSQVNLVFTNSNGEPVTLPTSFAPEATLPATSGTDIIVAVESTYSSSYEFIGWYTSPTPGSDDRPVTTVPQSSSGTVVLYPVIKVKTANITFNCQAVTSDGNTQVPVYLYTVKNNAEVRSTAANNTYSFNVGDPLPGSSASVTHVGVDDSDLARAYVFEGWYSTAAGAKALDSTRKVSYVTESCTLYAGITLKTYKITYVNLFPEAGRLVTPTSGSGAITYETIDNRVIATVPGNAQFTLPVPMDENASGSDAVLHIEDADTVGDGSFVFCGLGIGQSGDSINFGRLLLENDASSVTYHNQISGSFISCVGADSDSYTTPITPESDMTFYLYFGLPITLTINDLEGNTRLVKADGQKAPIAAALEECGYDSSSSDRQIIRLRQDTNTQHTAAQKLVYDQYWCVDNIDGYQYGETEWRFSTYYFGKPLDIPSFEDSVLGSDYFASYGVFGPELSLENIPYTNKPTSGKSSADISFCGSGSQSFPFNKYVRNNNHLQFWYMDVNLTRQSYAILDLSEDGLNVELGDYYRNVIRTPIMAPEDDHKYEVIIDKPELAYLAYMPEDGTYDWSHAGQTRDIANDTTAATQFRVSKEGYRLAGYSITPYQWSNGAQNGPSWICPVNGLQTVNYITYTTSYDLDYQYAYTTIGETIGAKFVIKPIFVPADKPFDVQLTRTNGKIAKTSWTDGKAMSDYLLEISGLEMLGDLPYVTSINLTNLTMECYYPGYNDGQFCALNLNCELKWDSTKTAYVLYASGLNTPLNQKTYAIADGKVIIPLLDIHGFQWAGNTSGEYYDPAFVRGCKFGEYFQAYFSYKTSITGEEFECATDSAGANPTTFATYYPYKSYVTLPENSDKSFTAVYLNSEITSIFSESIGTIVNPLQTLSGKSAENLKDVWYGGRIIAEEPNYLSVDPLSLDDMDKWVISRATSAGPAWKVVRGNVPLAKVRGAGILIFEPYKWLTVTSANLNKVNVYRVENFTFENGVLTPTDLAIEQGNNHPIDLSGYSSHVSNGIMKLQLYTGQSSQTQINIDVSTIPDGWAVASVGSSLFYINYGSYMDQELVSIKLASELAQ